MVKLIKKESLSKELRKIKDQIFRDERVRWYTSRVFQDRGDWKPFRELIQSIKDSSPLIEWVYYSDDPNFPQGYVWKDGVMTSKYREIEIQTSEGNLYGSIKCFGAGTVEDPLSSYDMVLEIYG